jgi:hypothetical protein
MASRSFRELSSSGQFDVERGAVGIRRETAAVIVRQYGEQFRRTPERKKTRRDRGPCCEWLTARGPEPHNVIFWKIAKPNVKLRFGLAAAKL